MKIFAFRSRLLYGLCILLLIFTGLAFVKYGWRLPPWFSQSGGDYLWGGMVYLIFAFIFPSWRTKSVLLAALLFCTAIECSQLYHAPWIDSLRSSKLAWLVLGSRFDWNDLFWYALGCLTAFGMEWGLKHKPVTRLLVKKRKLKSS